MAFTKPNYDEVPINVAQAIQYQTDWGALVAGINGDGVVSGCAVTAQGSPDNTVAVAAGVVKVGTVYAPVSAGNVTMPAADATNPRWVVITADNTGAKTATAGTAAAAPLLPALPANSVLLAAIWWPANDTTVSTAQITDGRVVIGSDPPMARPKRSGVTYYDAPGVSLYGWSTQQYEGSRLYYFPFFVTGRSLSLGTMAFNVTTAASGGNTARLAIYRSDIDLQPKALLYSATGIDITTTGVKSVAPALTVTPGIYLMAFWPTGNVDLGVRLAASPYGLFSTLGEFNVLRRLKLFRDTTAFPTWSDPGTLWDDPENTNTGLEYPVFLSID